VPQGTPHPAERGTHGFNKHDFSFTHSFIPPFWKMITCYCAFLQYVQDLDLQYFELRKINLPPLGNDTPLNQHVDYIAFCPVIQSLNLAPSPENCPEKICR
ncbi:MAG: hypothetical protein QME27_05645, partial [Syntrophaceae bacterium]|nr:hypothetical protein [Syntrophaceae bacterium]